MASCGGCLAFVALLAWMGSSAGRDATPAPDAPAARTSSTAPAFEGRAADHRKQVFDERRAHYDEAWHAKAKAADTSASVALNRTVRSAAGEHH
jgi:hypothetical protein